MLSTILVYILAAHYFYAICLYKYVVILYFTMSVHDTVIYRRIPFTHLIYPSVIRFRPHATHFAAA